MDKVDYYFQHYQDAKRDLIIAKNLIENYKPISEDAFLYSLATRQTNEERVKTSKTNVRTENMALSFHDKFLAEEREYQESLFEKYCHLKTDLDFFELAVSSVDEITRITILPKGG